MERMTKIQLVTQDCHPPPTHFSPPSLAVLLFSWKPRDIQVQKSTAGLLSYLPPRSPSCCRRCCRPALLPSAAREGNVGGE